VIASKDISVSLTNDRAHLILRYMMHNKPESLIIEALKCIAFLSMQVRRGRREAFDRSIDFFAMF
jgi:hypothetical protein